MRLAEANSIGGSARDRTRGVSRRLRGGEGGYIVVIVMLLLAIALAAAAAALAESLGARDNAAQTARSSRALQAADAGIQTELYRANQINFSGLYTTKGLSLSSIISQLYTCPVPQVNVSGQISGLSFTSLTSVGGSCPSNGASATNSPANSKEPVGDHAYYDVRFIPGTTNIGDFIEFVPKIAALGLDDGGPGASSTVTRRVEAILAPVMPWRTFEAGHDLTFNIPGTVNALGILGVGSTTFNGTAAAGNNLNLSGPSTLLAASTFTASGVSLSGGLTEPTALDYCNQFNQASNVTLSLTLGNITKPTSGCSGLVNRPTVQLSPSKVNCAPATGAVSCSTLFSSLGSYYSSTTDSLYCASTTSCPSLTLQPGDYVFCDFQWNGPVTLNASASQAVRIFIDNPSSSRCGNPASHASTTISGFQTSYGNFVATHGVGNALGLTNPSRAQVYVVGNGANDGTVAYATGDTTLSSQDMFLYAPTSKVTVSGGQTCVLGTCVNSGTLSGAYIGWDVTASGAVVTEDLGLLNYPLSSTLGPFYVKQYLECSSTTQSSFDSASDPTSGC